MDHTTIGTVSMRLEPRLFRNAEANARLDSDTVHSTVQNVQVDVGTAAGRIGLNGSWNGG